MTRTARQSRAGSPNENEAVGAFASQDDSLRPLLLPSRDEAPFGCASHDEADQAPLGCASSDEAPRASSHEDGISPPRSHRPRGLSARLPTRSESPAKVRHGARQALPSLVAAALLPAIVAACGPDIPDRQQHDDGQDTNGTQDELEPVWSQVSGVLAARCAGCHAPGGMYPDLSSEDVHADIVGGVSQQLPSLALVQPGDTDASYLYLKITGLHVEACIDAGIAESQCGSQMPPPPQPQLGQEETRALRDWIAEGATLEE